jgi:molybdopterin-containing oxidoreductase family membrane subunit
MEIVMNLVQCLFSGFQITVIVLFIMKMILKKHDSLWRNLFLMSNCILLVTSLVYGVVYLIELYSVWYSQVGYEQQSLKWRVLGPYWWSYWAMILVPFVLPQILWFKKFRRSYRTSLLLVPFLSFGSILERLIIIITTYYRDYLPLSWAYYAPHPSEMFVTFFIFTVVLMLLYFACRKKLLQISDEKAL